MNWVLVSLLLLLPAATWCSPEYPDEGIHVNSEEEHLEGIDVQTKQDDLAGIEVKVGEEQLNGIDVNVEVKNLAGIDVKAGNDHLIGIVVNDDNHLEGIDEKAIYNHMLDTPVKTVEGFHHSVDDVKTEKEHLSQLSERGDQKGIDKMIVNIFKPEEEDPTEVELANQTDLDSIQVQEADPLSPALNGNSAALNKSDDTVGESEYGILMTRLMDMIGIGESGSNPTDIDSNARDELSSEIDVKAEEEFTSAIDVKAKEHLSQDEINMISKIYMSKYEDLTGSNEMADDQQLTEIDLTIQDENPTGNDAAVEENDSSEIGFVEQSKAFVAKLFDMIGLRNSNNSPPKTCSSSSPLYYADLTDTNCKQFYHCSDGDDPYLVECSPGTRWAPKLHTCDDKENVLCPRTSSDDMSVARCEFKGEGTGEVFGEVIIIQVKDDFNGSHFQGKIIGLAPGLHGFHVHAVGNLSNDCKAAGGHFNPNNVTHGHKDDDVRHVGDLGNLETGENGAMLVDLWDSVALLNGTNSIIGKAIVVHEGEDDEGSGGNNGSLVHGNAGARAGCCIIEEV